MSFGARARIRLGALRHNLSNIRAQAPENKIMAVIKANAYGHGMVTVARTLHDVDALAVARVSEAVELRNSDVHQPLVLLAGVLDQTELEAAIDGDFQPVVHCDEQLALLDANRGGSVDVWLKLDTGMNRLGFSASRAGELIERLQAMTTVRNVRVMTHLSSADEVDAQTTARQLQLFASALKGFEGDISVANTPATLAWPSTTKLIGNGENWIRPGIALFGVSPFADLAASEWDLQPVMQFEARLIAVKPLGKGARVGYKGAYTSPKDTTMGVISAGYGDGYSRHFRSGTPVLINGRRVPLIGNVSMDMISVDLGKESTDRVGDLATLWGDDLPVEEVAPWANAIPYELLCGVMNREASEIIR